MKRQHELDSWLEKSGHRFGLEQAQVDDLPRAKEFWEKQTGRELGWDEVVKLEHDLDEAHEPAPITVAAN